MGYSTFYITTLSFVAGIFLASHSEIISYSIALLVLFISGILLLYFYLNQGSVSRKIILVLIVCVASSAGIARYRFFIRETGDSNLKKYIDQTLMGEGVIVSEPEEREKAIRYVLAIDTIVSDSKSISLSPTKILVTDSLYSQRAYGDRISFEGVLEKPEGFETESGRIFDYESFLARKKIFYLMKRARVTFVSARQASTLKYFLFLIKRSFVRKIDSVISYPESRLASGIVVAGKGALPADIQEDFKKSGTMQIVVLSGTNVTIIAQTLMTLLSSLPKTYAAVSGVAGIILFTIMTGADATIVRGSVMAILVVISTLVRRDYNINRSLVAAACLMLLINPMLLVYDPSFQLSFLATMGLIYGGPIVAHYLSWITERWALRDTIATSVATQLFVTPFILFSSGDVSFMALPANLFVSFIIPLAMLLSFMSGLAAFIHPYLALPIALLAFLVLRYALMTVHFFAAIPFSFINIGQIPWWVIVVVYACYAVIIYRFRRRETAELPSITEIKSP